MYRTLRYHDKIGFPEYEIFHHERDPRELKEEDPLFCMEYNYGMYKTTLSLKAVACFFNTYEIGFLVELP